MIENGHYSSNLPPWLMIHITQASQYWSDTLVAFRRASIGIEGAVTPDDQHHRSIILGHALVAQCGMLEALVRDVLTGWLIHTPAAWHAKRVADLKTTVGDWTGKNTEAQAKWVITELWKSSGGPDRNPVTRFETLFAALGIQRTDRLLPSVLQIDDLDRSHTLALLAELWAVRNIIVHHMGVVDAQFCVTCPHLAGTEGQELVITHEEFDRYTHTVVVYMLHMMYRLGHAFGLVARASAQSDVPPADGADKDGSPRFVQE